jgi:hypothetical protein
MEITSETRAPEEAIPPRFAPPGLLLAALGAPSSAPARVLRMLMIRLPISLLWPADHSAIIACQARAWRLNEALEAQQLLLSNR